MKSVLIVGECSLNRRTLLRALVLHNWWVDVAESVEATLVFLNQPPRRVVVIDWRVANGSGLALLRAIRAHLVWHSIPVVMLHEDRESGEIERAFDLGANDFLCSPFTQEAGLRKLERWVLDSAGPAEHELEDSPRW